MFDFRYSEDEMRLIANKLYQLQAKENDGRGITCVKSIVTYLKAGDLRSAVLIRQHDGDKTITYYDVEQYLIEKLGCRSHGKINCTNTMLCGK